jgi:hypothetical protein
LGPDVTKVAPIKEVSIEEDGRLCVYPDTSVSGDFEFIWRDASGIRWDTKANALVAYEPHRWEAVTLYGQIILAVKSEYGWQLNLTPATSWRGVSEEIKEKIQSWSSANILHVS